MHKMIEFEKIYTLTTENLFNLGAYRMIKILSVLNNAYIVSKDQNKFVFYINNNIDWDHFNQLYDSDWIEKSMINAGAVTDKLRPALTRVINQRFEVAREKRWKRKEMIEIQKTKAIAVKCQRARKGISLSNKEKKN